MVLFYTNSAKHLAKRIKVKKGNFVIKKFSDGEIHVKVKSNVKGKTVWVLASTYAPADNLLELIFLLDALKRKKAKINLLISYFGYARQDKTEEGESFGGKIISELLQKFKLNKCIIIHIHSGKLKKYLDYKNVIPLKLFHTIINSMNVVVAPDKGSLELARKFVKNTNLSLAYMEKVRPKHEKVKIMKVKGQVKGKKIIIVDDMISTAGTVVEASKVLKRKGAKEIYVISTHGVFSANAIKKIEKSVIKKVYVTNSIVQKFRSRKVKVFDLSKFVENILKRKNLSRTPESSSERS